MGASRLTQTLNRLRGPTLVRARDGRARRQECDGDLCLRVGRIRENRVEEVEPGMGVLGQYEVKAGDGTPVSAWLRSVSCPTP